MTFLLSLNLAYGCSLPTLDLAGFFGFMKVHGNLGCWYLSERNDNFYAGTRSVRKTE